MVRSSRHLLARYAALINKYGVDSRQAKKFLDEHRDNGEFIELAELSRTLKLALTSPVYGCNPDHITYRT